MEPLYCFRLYPDTGKITCLKIEDYSQVTVCTFTSRYCLEYVDPTTKYLNRVRPENIDKLVHNKVYTFDPDPDRAKEIINNAILDKLNAAVAEKEKWLEIYDKLL